MFGDNVTQGFVAPLVVAVVVRAYLKQVRLTGLQVPQLAKIVEEVSEVGDRRRERRKVIVFDVCRLTYERPFSRESVTGSRVHRTVFLGGHHLNDFEPRQEPRFVRTYVRGAPLRRARRTPVIEPLMLHCTYFARNKLFTPSPPSGLA